MDCNLPDSLRLTLVPFMMPGIQRRGNAANGLKLPLSFARGRGKAAYGFKLPLSL